MIHQQASEKDHMCGALAAPDALPMRPACQVMDLNRLGSLHQSRLSFMRTLIRRMVTENWQVDISLFDLDAQGYGTVIYEIKANYGTFSFVVFSHYLSPESRNDRVIANQWDLTMALRRELLMLNS